MANPKIKFKRSAVASKTPTLENIELGELALNTYDGKVFLRQDTSGVGIGTTVTVVNPWTENYGGTEITYNGNVSLGDNNELRLGDGPDLKIYHDGSHSYIDDTGVGNVRIRAGTVEITNLAGSKKSATFNSASGQQLYYNDNLRFETTNHGAIVTGILTASSFVGDGSNLTGVATSAVSISTSTPSSPSAGDLWFDPDYGRTLIYYDDGSSQQWIDASPVATTISSATNLQVTGVCTATTFDGNLELDQAAVESVTSTKTSTSEDSVDSFAAATYRSVTYDIQITRGSSYHTTTIKVVHDGTDTYMTEYGTMNTGSSLATFSSDISGGNVRLLATPSSATSTVFKIVKTLIKV